MEAIIITPKSFSELYNDLNESKKAILRTSFLKEYGYSLKSDSFYRKLRGDSLFSPNEQKWICAHMKLPIEQVLFPTR